jgi:hypothetical protein
VPRSLFPFIYFTGLRYLPCKGKEMLSPSTAFYLYPNRPKLGIVNLSGAIFSVLSLLLLSCVPTLAAGAAQCLIFNLLKTF